MKNWFLFMLLITPICLMAQHHEIQISYQPFEQEVFNKGVSLSYFHKISEKQAVGIRAIYNGFGQNTDRFSGGTHYGSLDLLSRRDFIQTRFFQLQGEAGLSAMRRYKGESFFLICGNSSIQELERMMHFGRSSRDNLFGFSTGLTTQFNFTEAIGIGATYQIKMLFLSEDIPYETNIFFDLFHLNLSYKF